MSEAVRAALESSLDGLAESQAKADAGFLWDFWYPALPSDEIYGKNLATAMLLDSVAHGSRQAESGPDRGGTLSM